MIIRLRLRQTKKSKRLTNDLYGIRSGDGKRNVLNQSMRPNKFRIGFTDQR